MAPVAKPLTPYMKHMKESLAKIKSDQPNIKHMDAFKLAASMWKKSPHHPDNAGNKDKKSLVKSTAKSTPKSSVKKTIAGGKAVVKKKTPVKKKTVVKKKASAKK